MKKSNLLKFASLFLLIVFVLLSCSENSTKTTVSPDDNGGPHNTGTNYPDDRLYNEDHHWVKIGEDNVAIVGVTNYPLNNLGIIYSVEDIPIKIHGPIRRIVSELHGANGDMTIIMPIGGFLDTSNPLIFSDPAIINLDPYGAGWLFTITDYSQAEIDLLMTADEYEDYLGQNP